jgi:hypothetical protein
VFDEGYERAVFITDDPFFTRRNPYPGVDSAAQIPGCTPGLGAAPTT